jgi:formylglycine-generating enzyme required for sulfatase activity
MSTTEVTWNEYELFAFSFDIKNKKKQGVDLSSQPESEKSADAVTRPTPPYADETFGLGREGQPVICITHHAAMEYCRWLSVKTEKSIDCRRSGVGICLPRRNQTAYSFGTIQPTSKTMPGMWIIRAGSLRRLGRESQILGDYTICGNAAEWVLDEYDPKFYSTFKEGSW